MTPLYIAAQMGHLAVVEPLVQAGVSIDQAKANGTNAGEWYLVLFMLLPREYQLF